MRIILPVIFIFFSFNFLLAETKLKVGIELPLTGVAAGLGEAMQRGISLYQKHHPEINEKIEIIYEDHKYDGKATVTAYHNLTKVKKTDLVVVWGNTPSSILAPIAEREKYPILAVTFDPYGKDKDYVLTFGGPIETYSEYVARFFKERRAERPAAIYINIGDVLESIRILKEKINVELIEEEVEAERSDFSSLITKLKTKNPDLLLLFLATEQALVFAKQAKQQKFDIPVIGGDIFASDKFIKEFLGYMSDFTCVYAAVKPEFMQEFHKEYNATTYIAEAATGYSIMQMLAQIKDWNPSDFKANFENLNYDNAKLLGVEFLDNQDFGKHITWDIKNYTPEDFMVN